MTDPLSPEEINRQETQMDELRKAVVRQEEFWREENRLVVARAQAAEAEVQRLTQALRAFERDPEDGEFPAVATTGDEVILVAVPFDAVKAARAALAQTQAPDHE